MDIKCWSERLSDPLWYREIVPEFTKIMELREQSKEEYKRKKEAVYRLFEQGLREGTIALGTSGPNLDAERMPIDTIVIHHTGNPPGMSRLRLSAIELIRLYAPQYLLKRNEEPIYSGHFEDGTQVFYPYHWFVRKDGSVERLLPDRAIGWHAGNWLVNRRSCAICFDDNFENSAPSECELEAAARIIRENYSQVRQENIYGHCEIKPETICPSRLFIRGWKRDLLVRI